MSPTIKAIPINSRLLTLELKNIAKSQFTMIKKETLEGLKAKGALKRPFNQSLNL